MCIAVLGLAAYLLEEAEVLAEFLPQGLILLLLV